MNTLLYELKEKIVGQIQIVSLSILLNTNKEFLNLCKNTKEYKYKKTQYDCVIYIELVKNKFLYIFQKNSQKVNLLNKKISEVLVKYTSEWIPIILNELDNLSIINCIYEIGFFINYKIGVELLKMLKKKCRYYKKDIIKIFGEDYIYYEDIIEYFSSTNKSEYILLLLTNYEV